MKPTCCRSLQLTANAVSCPIPNPTTYFDFETFTGNDVTDIVSAKTLTQNSMTPPNSVWRANPGFIGNSCYLPLATAGGNPYFRNNTPGWWDWYSDPVGFSVAFWFRSTDTPPFPQMSIYTDDNSGAFQVQLLVTNSGPWVDFQAIFYVGGFVSKVVHWGALATPLVNRIFVAYDGNWHRYSLTFDKVTKDASVKFDNQTTNTNNIGAINFGTATKLIVEPNYYGSGSPVGGFDLDELSIWTGKVLTEPELLCHWNGGAGKTFNGTIWV